jgi:FkbM family methyltransferase
LSIGLFRSIERRVRRARDELLFKRIARAPAIQRLAISEFEIIVKDCGDHWVAFNPKDLVIGRRIRQSGQWRRRDFEKVLRALASLDRPSKVFLDVGANIGTQSIYALLTGLFERVVAIEPVEANLRCLRLNAFLNDLTDRIEIVAAAAGASEGSQIISISVDNHGAHSLKVDHEGQVATVDVVTIDSLLTRLAILPTDVGLWLVDTEGSEAEVVEGGRTLIGAKVPLCLELSPPLCGAKAAENLMRDLATHYTRAGVVTPDSEEVEMRPLSELDISRLPAWQVDLLLL